MWRILALLMMLLTSSLAALEVRVQPGDFVYAYEVDPARGLYTVMLQNVAIVQKEGGPVTLDSLEIQAVHGGQAVQTVVIPAADLEKSAKRLSALDARSASSATPATPPSRTSTSSSPTAPTRCTREGCRSSSRTPPWKGWASKAGRFRRGWIVTALSATPRSR